MCTGIASIQSVRATENEIRMCSRLAGLPQGLQFGSSFMSNVAKLFRVDNA